MAVPLRDRVDVTLDEWQDECPDLDASSLAVTSRLLRAGRILQARLDQIATSHGLSHKGDLDVLTGLQRCGPPYESTPTRLADLLLLTTGGMTNRIDRLERADLVARRPNPADRRGVVVALTAQGHRVAERVFRDILRAQEAIVASLAPDAATALATALRQLLLEMGDSAELS